MRTIASQMEGRRGQTVSLRIAGTSSAGEQAEFGASGTVITFRGFLAAYEEGRDDDPTKDDDERRLPNVAEGDAVQLKELEPQGHETNPPARYTEATLVQDARGARHRPPVDVRVDPRHDPRPRLRLQERHRARAVVPRVRGRRLLEQHFGRLVDYDFTARMEDDLDRIAAGDEQRRLAEPLLLRRRDGNGLKELVSDLGEIDAREINSIEIGNGIVLRVGRYGPYLERDGQRASVPDDLAPDELTVEKAEELLAQPSGDRELGTDPETGREIVARTGRYGPYVTEVLRGGSKEKPRTASLFKTMSLDTVTLDDALQLLSLPRVVGVGATARR